jgi:shikimate kinase
MPRHLVLVGLSGAGKSTVGRLAAEQLGAPCIDIDAFLMRQMGMPVAQIFGMVGEAEFRSMERSAVRAALGGPPAVLVPGGGWAAQEGELDAARETSVIIYLRCQPTVAAKRAQQGETRPLLSGPDPAARLRAQLEAREPFYSRAHHEVRTDYKTAAEVAAEIVRLAKGEAGW